MIDILNTSCEIVIKWMSQNLPNWKSTLVQIVAQYVNPWPAEHHSADHSAYRTDNHAMEDTGPFTIAI